MTFIDQRAPRVLRRNAIEKVVAFLKPAQFMGAGHNVIDKYRELK
jgi:hypothetical protein